MRNFAFKSLLAMGSAVVLMAAGSASAQIVVKPSSATSPVSSTWRLNGDLAMHQSQDLTCNADFYLTVNADGKTGSVTSGSFSGGLGCGFPLVYPRNFSWPVTFTYVDTNTATFNMALDVQALFNVCVGSLTGTFRDTQEVEFNTASVAGSSPVCTVDGVLSVTPISHPSNTLEVVP